MKTIDKIASWLILLTVVSLLTAFVLVLIHNRSDDTRTFEVAMFFLSLALLIFMYVHVIGLSGLRAGADFFSSASRGALTLFYLFLSPFIIFIFCLCFSGELLQINLKEGERMWQVALADPGYRVVLKKTIWASLIIYVALTYTGLILRVKNYAYIKRRDELMARIISKRNKEEVLSSLTEQTNCELGNRVMS